MQENMINSNIDELGEITELGRLLLKDDWCLFKSAANQYRSPAEFDFSEQKLFETSIPSTVASAIALKEPDCWTPNINYDDFDWWYRFEFSSLKELFNFSKQNTPRLYFDGLATLCEIWFNDNKLLTTENMFRGYQLDLENDIKPTDQLILVFRSVSNTFNIKRPRPRWKTKLVKNQQMRWIRTTVLGHVSAWTPPIKAVGPWRDIRIETAKSFRLESFVILPSAKGKIAQLSLSGNIKNLNNDNILSASIELGEQNYPINLVENNDHLELSADLALPDLELWWPHTHGQPTTHSFKIIITTAKRKTVIKTGKLGFKSTQFISNSKESAFFINQEKVFCRGTCWTVSNYLSLNAPTKEVNELLKLMKSAGINMIRVGGTMVYESNCFYNLCDELGILIWQDFMFASMDYPLNDSNFIDNITEEVSYQLNRLSRYACISIYCGNSDIEAQAAMSGIPKSNWSSPFFDTDLQQMCNSLHPSIPYISSSPTGGALPFHLSEGVSHYWGVGAYMHPVSDQNKQLVKFASEGMGLSHIPEDKIIYDSIGKQSLFPYSNDWNYRTPRDLGAGWCFDEIRDFYLEDLFKINARQLKRSNVEEYIALSRIVTGESLARVFQYWRSKKSDCNGGLVWFNRDFWPSAGFGLIDSNNQPKPAFYQLKQVWQNIQVVIINEGLDGAKATFINETNNPFNGIIKLQLIKNNKIIIADITENITIEGKMSTDISIDKILQNFFDTGYAYRFGKPQFDLLACHLLDKNNDVISDSFLFPNGLNLSKINSAEIEATAEEIDKDTFKLRIISDNFLQFLRINVRGYLPDSNYFHLLPLTEKIIYLKRNTNQKVNFKGSMEAINLAYSVKIKLL